MPSYFLGVDGGQSGTTALLADGQGRIVGRGSAGPCNHVQESEGRERFTSAIRESVGAACGAAGLNPAAVEFDSACLGLSGGPADKELLAATLVPARRLLVTHDALIALSGATGGRPGVIVISGTGSIAFGRNSSGRTARAGGWGYIFGDEGSAFDIARQGLRAALRFEEGWGPPTQLLQALLAATSSPNANDLLHRFYTPEFPRSRVATLAQVVDEAGSRGDAVARAILERAALDLLALVRAVHDNLFRPEETPRISYLGGVFRGNLLRSRFLEAFTGSASIPEPPLHGPAAGALLEAFRIAGVTISLTGATEED